MQKGNKEIFNRHKVCLILEGYEENSYFERLKKIGIFNSIYDITLINAKSASKISIHYSDKYAINSYEVILVVCDHDRKPEEFNKIKREIDNILGEKKSEYVMFYTKPCTLQVILSHFGNVRLTTQAKKDAREDVERLTGVKDYDAHEDQLNDICKQVTKSNYKEMKEKIIAIGKDFNNPQASNLDVLFNDLENTDSSWIDTINKELEE